MKRIYTIIAAALTLLAMQAAVADTTLLRFDLTHYRNWTYHRPGVELTNILIQQGNVNLFVSETGVNYTLESPVWQGQGMDSIKVHIDYRPHLPYQAAKVALQVDLLDNKRTVVSTITLPVPKNVVMHDFETTLRVPQPGEYTLLLSAPNADVDNCAGIRQVEVWAVSRDDIVRGDVSGDGIVDVADVNALINVILGKVQANQYGDRALVTDDDVVDVADVNAIINIILNK